MPVNSRAKGAHGEREAAKYLTKLGFPCKRMGRNGYSDSDLKGIEECLPNLHIEVKYGVKGMDVGTKLLLKAWEQSAYAAGWGDLVETTISGNKATARVLAGPVPVPGSTSDPDIRCPVVLWKPPFRAWRLTWHSDTYKHLVTVAGDYEIAFVLRKLNGGE